MRLKSLCGCGVRRHRLIPGAVIGGFIIGITRALLKCRRYPTIDAFTFALLMWCWPSNFGLFSENLTESVMTMKQEKKHIYLGPHWRWPLCWWCWHWIQPELCASMLLTVLHQRVPSMHWWLSP
ncbi:MAG: hypothetical protein ACLVJH_12575 [Faecalibacterium prausnitzii]